MHLPEHRLQLRLLTATEGKRLNRKAAEAFPLHMKSRLRISTEALRHLLLYRTQCSDTPVTCFSSSRGFHKSSSVLGAVGQILHGKVAVVEGGSLAAFHWSPEAGMATLTTAKCMSRHHNRSFQQPCLTLCLSPVEQENTNPPTQREGTNPLQSPTHRHRSPLRAALQAGQCFAREISQCLLALRAE